MHNPTKKILEPLGNVKNLLLHRRKNIEQDLKALDAEDPVLDRGLAESSEPGTDSWIADTHGRVTAMKQSLLNSLNGIKRALTNIRSGKYGKCEKCGKPIEEARLKVIPTATLCIYCSTTKAAKKT